MTEPPYAPPYQPYPPQQPRQPQSSTRYPQPGRQQPPPGYGQPPRPAPVVRPQQGRLDPETRSQVRAAYDARAELGPEFDDAIAAGLADRVEELVAYRTAELRHADEEKREERADLRRLSTQRFTLGIVSLGSGIPITAIAAQGVDQGLLGVVVAWAGIVGVNAVFAWGSRRRQRP